LRKAIVLGGYGLIGSACMRALRAAGFKVIGVGRSRRAALESDPTAEWRIHDLPKLTGSEWRDLLVDADVVVNAAGALQDGTRDDLEAIHVTTPSRLTEAARDLPLRIVQISADGVSAQATTAFFRSKARGDAVLAALATDWVILRPTLVLSPEAYGGTALLRGVAGAPLIVPRVLPEAQIQIVHVADLAAAVVTAAQGLVPSGTIADITAADAHSFADLVTRIRAWQGFPAPLFRPNLPSWLLTLSGKGADLMGHLGWRPALRSTALRTLAEGVRGDPGTWAALTGQTCRGLNQTLADLPATRQERLYARLYFALPLSIAILALFWSLSGLITLIDPARAIAVLHSRGAPGWFALLAVFGGALADLALGMAILWRPWTRGAALGMVALSAGYVAGSLVAAPDLWLDPLGPMLKVLPGMVLAGIVALTLEER
jgi:uncharacterized protein YbjT (DUF2867 family)